MNSSPSPNFNARAVGVPLAYIVLHYTGMKDAASALARLCDPTSNVSAHYLIDEDGTVTQLVDEQKRTWHAGHSFWRGITDMNSASIGIELVNPGHEFGYRAFPAPQIAALKTLLPPIIARHAMNPKTCLLAHSDIAPTRKQDPGELFPWHDLAHEGLGLWPSTTSDKPEPMSENDLRAALSSIGYDVQNVQAALTAFQRRFCPECLNKQLDPKTMTILRIAEALWTSDI